MKLIIMYKLSVADSSSFTRWGGYYLLYCANLLLRKLKGCVHDLTIIQSKYIWCDRHGILVNPKKIERPSVTNRKQMDLTFFNKMERLILSNKNKAGQ